MYGYIYKTTDKTNGKIYIGKRHSSEFQGFKYIGSGLIIKNIKNKCEENNVSLQERFNVEMIDTADTLEELNEKEIYWIEKLNARDSNIGYNMRKGGDCGPGGPMFKGHKHSQETRDKMSKSRIGSGNGNYGNRWHQSDELRKLHSILSTGENNGMYGKKHSDESKLKNRLSHVGKIAVSNINLNKVLMINKDELEVYLSNGWIKGNIHCKKK